MTDARTAWSEVGDRLDALALKLKLHAEADLGTVDEELRTTLQRLRGAAGELVDSLGEMSRDPAVRADVRAVADGLSDALEASARRAREVLRGG